MEILTYILEGTLEHKDSMGTGSLIKRGDIQRMSAGTGVTHSEYNASKKDVVHLLQIWILPEKGGIKPGYEQTHLEDNSRKNRLYSMASGQSKNGAVTIHQDVEVFTALLDKGQKIDYSFKNKRYGWLQVAAGAVEVNGKMLEAGDGAAISEEKQLDIISEKDSELLLFDLA